MHAAAAQGTLKERPLPRLLQQLYRKQFTGHFVVSDETQDRSEVYLREGSPVHVCRPVDTDRLDNLLVEYGLVSAEVLAEASAQVTPGQRLGDLLERMGALDKEKLADVLKAQFRKSDIVGRIGGDEFTVFASNTNEKQIGFFQSRISELLDAFNGRSGKPYALGLSLGCAECPPYGDSTLGDYMNEADSLLYARKAARKAAGTRAAGTREAPHPRAARRGRPRCRPSS